MTTSIKDQDSRQSLELGLGLGLALVTGGSRGIGRSIALRLARDGWTVAIAYASKVEEANAVATAITDTGGRAFIVKADISQSSEVTQLFQTIGRRPEPLKVVVNNAGVNSERPMNMVETSDEEFDRLFNINARGAFLVMREAARSIDRNGRIINVSTSVTKLNLPGYSAYAGSKAAVESFTKILSKELRGRNITVNAISPGPTDTDLFRQGKTEADLNRFAMMSPLERLGTPNDIAGIASFLASNDGSWVNGQVIPVNGGLI
ncbi:MAG: SDR family oxidoreductase [Proteobacteria bacterium]|nr:SDR family oxidoreductase [Pseudomonadota bacterium]